MQQHFYRIISLSYLPKCNRRFSHKQKQICAAKLKVVLQFGPKTHQQHNIINENA